MIQLTQIKKVFKQDDSEVMALDNVSLQIEQGDIFGIIGYSGAGKSTLIRCINGLEKPSSGKVEVMGYEIGQLTEKELMGVRKEIGMIFQHFNLMQSKSVFDNIIFPLKHTQLSKQDKEKRVKELLELVGLEDKRKAYPSQLSGGQKQRVAIARALATNPKILLCDEATSALDPQTTRSILELLKQINKKLGITVVLITHQMEVTNPKILLCDEATSALDPQTTRSILELLKQINKKLGITVVLITHQMEVIKEICTKVAVMEKGKILETGSLVEVFGEPKSHITKEFVNKAFHYERFNQPKSGEVAKLLHLKYIGEVSGKPLISDISRRFNVEANITVGNIEKLQDTWIGNLVIDLQGKLDNLEQAIDYLKAENVEMEVIEDERITNTNYA